MIFLSVLHHYSYYTIMSVHTKNWKSGLTFLTFRYTDPKWICDQSANDVRGLGI